MTYKEMLQIMAEGTGLPARTVDRAYRSYWRVVRDHISSMPLDKDLTDAEFLKLRPNVNIPSLGKFHVTLDRYRGMRKHFEVVGKLHDEKEKKKKDVRSLISIKPGLISAQSSEPEKRTEIQPKSAEESKEA